MRLSLLTFLVLASSAHHAADTSSFKPDAFLSRYCLGCHDADVQKGDRRLDNLPLSIGTDINASERWQEVLHQLHLGEMPPAKKKQPRDEERRALLSWIDGQLPQVQSIAQERGGRVVHRRLNRAEYRHTMQDVFGFDGDFDPKTSFPGDDEMEGFRNIGSALHTPRHHLEQYLKAAAAVLDHAYDLADVNGRQEVKQWKDSAENMSPLNDAFGLGVISAEKANGPAYIHLSHGLRNQELIFDSKLFLSRLGDAGVPHSGWYDVEVEATAANRHHPYRKDLTLGLLSAFYKDLKSCYTLEHEGKLYIGYTHKGYGVNEVAVIPVASLNVFLQLLPERRDDYARRLRRTCTTSSVAEGIVPRIRWRPRSDERRRPAALDTGAWLLGLRAVSDCR
jgi:Protein of unknown function (DUF1587)/Planctomycete cytochrome C